MHNNDIEIIAILEKSCFTDCWSKEAIISQLSLENTIYKICYTQNIPVGYVLGTALSFECELYRIGVIGEFQRQGYAKKLLLDFIEICREKSESGSRLFLEVSSDNVKAQTFYKSAGFKEIARRTGYYDDFDALILEIKL